MTQRVYCWYHVKKAIQKHLNKIKDKAIRQKITDDIINFQKHIISSIFIEGAKLMITEWKQLKNEDVNYFITKFMKYLRPDRMGWFDHYCDWVPVTNNALESTNRYIKDHGNKLFFKYF